MILHRDEFIKLYTVTSESWTKPSTRRNPWKTSFHNWLQKGGGLQIGGWPNHYISLYYQSRKKPWNIRKIPGSLTNLWGDLRDPCFRSRWNLTIDRMAGCGRIFLVSGWTTQLKNMRRSNWIISRRIGVNIKIIWNNGPVLKMYLLLKMGDIAVLCQFTKRTIYHIWVVATQLFLIFTSSLIFCWLQREMTSESNIDPL